MVGFSKINNQHVLNFDVGFPEKRFSVASKKTKKTRLVQRHPLSEAQAPNASLRVVLCWSYNDAHAAQSRSWSEPEADVEGGLLGLLGDDLLLNDRKEAQSTEATEEKVALKSCDDIKSATPISFSFSWFAASNSAAA